MLCIFIILYIKYKYLIVNNLIFNDGVFVWLFDENIAFLTKKHKIS